MSWPNVIALCLYGLGKNIEWKDYGFNIVSKQGKQMSITPDWAPSENSYAIPIKRNNVAHGVSICDTTHYALILPYLTKQKENLLIIEPNKCRNWLKYNRGKWRLVKKEGVTYALVKDTDIDNFTEYLLNIERSED